MRLSGEENPQVQEQAQQGNLCIGKFSSASSRARSESELDDGAE